MVDEGKGPNVEEPLPGLCAFSSLLRFLITGGHDLIEETLLYVVNAECDRYEIWTRGVE